MLAGRTSEGTPARDKEIMRRIAQPKVSTAAEPVRSGAINEGGMCAALTTMVIVNQRAAPAPYSEP
jgi:hypothetical protein